MKRGAILSLLGVLAVTFTVFSRAATHDFTNWDDDTHVTNNLSVRVLSPAKVRHIFTSTLQHTYIPLTTLSFAVEHHFFGYRPFYYHLDNIFLHLGVTALVFVFALRLGFSVRASALAALIFGVHPMHVESVAWITERKDVLYAFFYMAALVSYLDYLKKRTAGPFVLACLWGLLSILAKPMALSLPLVLLVCDWYLKRPINQETVLEKVPFLVFIVPVAWITYALQMRVPGQGIVSSVLVWTWTLTFYVWKFFAPLVLLPLYRLPQPVSLLNPAYFLSIGLLVLLAVFLWKYRHFRPLVFAGLFFFASIFFLLRFDNRLDTHIVADRFMYLPSVGVCILLGIGGDRLLQSCHRMKTVLRFSGTAALALLVFLMCLKTSRQIDVWKNSFTLWNTLIRHAPGEALAYHNRGNAYFTAHHYDEARDDYNAALRIDPTYAEAYNSLGTLYCAEREYIRAFWYFGQAISIYPEYAEAYNNRGSLYARKKFYQQALRDFSRSIALKPDNPLAYFNRGNVLTTMRQDEAAIMDFSRAIEVNPEDSEAYNNRGVVYYRMGLTDKAGRDFRTAYRLNPFNASAAFNLSLVDNGSPEAGTGKQGEDRRSPDRVMRPVATIEITDQPNLPDKIKAE